MSARLRFRDRITLPWWLSLRPLKKVGYSIVWTMIAPLDAAIEVAVQGFQAWLPGVGTPTALPLIGRSRGILRAEGETDDEYAARLVDWLETWPRADQQQLLAELVHGYLGNRPKVRVVNRAGHWVTVDTDGTVTTTDHAFDWDSVSHPERNDPAAPWWSDMWIIVYTPEWTIRPLTIGDLPADPDLGTGHLAPLGTVEALKGLLAQWKGLHERVRAVIFTYDATLFDPTNPASLPNGTWGAWGTTGSGSRSKSGRNDTTCRYWEPR